jgi:uncharacterized protein involved in response to NO
LWILHLGYGWLALGFVLLAANSLAPLLPPTTALHALTTGAIGTMTLGVMTRASLGHTGHPLVAGRGTTTIYVLVTLAALLRLLAPLGGAHYVPLLSAAGAVPSDSLCCSTRGHSPCLGSKTGLAGQSERPRGSYCAS